MAPFNWSAPFCPCRWDLWGDGGHVAQLIKQAAAGGQIRLLTAVAAMLRALHGAAARDGFGARGRDGSGGHGRDESHAREVARPCWECFRTNCASFIAGANRAMRNKNTIYLNAILSSDIFTFIRCITAH